MSVSVGYDVLMERFLAPECVFVVGSQLLFGIGAVVRSHSLFEGLKRNDKIDPEEDEEDLLLHDGTAHLMSPQHV